MDKKIKILIIDDEEVVLDSCTMILEGEDYQIATAMDGAQGVNLAQEFRPDLVFVDLKMPGMSGLEVLGRVLAFDPTVVAIVITGYATVSSAVEAMKTGAYDFLPKPFTPDEFRLITRRGIEKRKLVLETIALRREREVLREQFAAIISHEVKSPLSAVQQNLYALAAELSDKLTESQRNRLERLQSRIDDLLKLINTWLRVVTVDISKLQEGFRPTAVEPAILKAIEVTQPHAVRKDIEIRSLITGPLAPIFGDEVTLVEALVNIIGNAIKYSRPGSQVTVTAANEGDLVAIAVADTGVGISQEDLPFIFDDFYAGRSGQVSERSSGVGLAITRRIIEAHRGEISVESEVGKGSTFVIRLPCLQDGPQGQATPVSVSQQTQ